MKKLLYFFPVRTSFVASDEEILRRTFSVVPFYFKPFPKWKTPYYFLAQFLFILRHLPRTKVLFSQFSGYHTFLPGFISRVFHIPHFIVLNGTECNNFPEIKYGYINRPLLFWFSKKSLQWSTRLLPVSEALVRADYSYTQTKYSQQGFLHFYHKVKTPYTVLYNGISPAHFNIDPAMTRIEKSFITVAAGLEGHNRRVVKGLDLVIDTAWKTPQYTYTFVGGKKTDALRLPSNIRIVDFVPHHELSALYNQHQFYLQLSLTEGFGLSVCEAMMSGCVPIVSDVGILPLIASEKGYVLKKKNSALLIGLMAKAIAEYTGDNLSFFRQHVLDHFPISLREKRLTDVVG